jgi:hypothetical protein
MGNYSIWRMSKTGAATAIQPWTNSDAINQGDWNLLRVVAQGDSLEFYINDQLVNSFTDSNFTKGYVGFEMYRPAGGSSRLYVDYADLTVLNEESATALTNTAVSEEQSVLNQQALKSSQVGSIEGYPE